MTPTNLPSFFKQRVHASALLLAVLLFLFNASLSAQSGADDLLGKYMVPSKDGAIEIYKTGSKYYGKIILNKDPEKLDFNNPDKTKQSRKVLGTTILNDFVFKGGQLWEDGTIYDPKNGKTYSCKITRMKNGDLEIRGFIGISLLGRTEVFVRLK
jgi:uncharacterized protein (DUF2147 family)